MNIALLVARLVLATVFGAAGAAKISGRDGTRATAAAFGVPARLTGPVTLALPAAELLIAAALIPASSAALAGWAALALLAVFSATVAISLARGRHPDCYCFGQFTAAPIGWRTLARNVALAAVAAFVALGGWWAGQLAGWPDGGTSLGELGTGRLATVAVVTALALAAIVDTALVVLLLGRRGTGPRGRDHAGAAAGGMPGPVPAVASPVRAVALQVGTAAPEFEVAGANHPPNNAPKPENEAGSWRIELSPAQPAATDTFLNVMQIMDDGVEALPVARTQDGVRIGEKNVKLPKP